MELSWRVGILWGLVAVLLSLQDESWLARKRLEMVEFQLKARDITDVRVLESMRKVPRHLFIDRSSWTEAYEDFPLPIGEGQTISQPYIVALMSQSLGLKGPERVLEVGTGSGYQAAVLGQLASQVFTIEINGTLAVRARRTLERLGYRNVTVKQGDGFFGWPEAAPFDAVIVTCAAQSVPDPLFAQLREAGRMVIPLGEPDGVQTLTIIRKRAGQPKVEEGIAVRFVPMTGENLKKKK